MKKITCFLIYTSCLIPTISNATKAREQALQMDANSMPLEDSINFPEISQKDPKLPLEKLILPEGAQISIFAVVPNARSLTLGEKGQ